MTAAAAPKERRGERGRRAAGPVFLLACLAGAGCAPEVRVEAVWGCGVDPPPDRVRVTVRGDFPSDPRIVVGRADIGTVPEGAAALTIEGLVGEDPVAVARTGPLEPRKDVLRAYYAGVESLCALPSQAKPRHHGAAGYGADAAVYAGGLAADGMLLADVIVAPRGAADARVFPVLPVPHAGGVVLPAEGAVYVAGGVGPAGVLASAVRIDLEDPAAPEASDPLPLWDGADPVRFGYAGADVGPDGTVLVAGGCTQAAAPGVCDPAAATAAVYRVTAEDPPRLDRLPDLPGPRIGPAVVVAADGGVFVGGGLGLGAEPELDLWRLGPGGFEPFGPPLTGYFDAGTFVADLDWLAPESLVVATSDGRLFWVGVDFVEEVPVPVTASANGRPAATVRVLPGERVWLDDVVMPVALAGADPTVDQGTGHLPQFPVHPTRSTPGPMRVGAAAAELGDGTMVTFGGYDPESGGLGTGAFVRRYRPPLEGPDEASTSLSDPTGRIVWHHPDMQLAPDGAVAIPGAGDVPGPVPRRGFHVRGVRGRHLRLSGRVFREGQGRLVAFHMVGASLGAVVEFGPASPGGTWIEGGTEQPLPCDGEGADPDGGRVRVEVDGREYRIFVEGAVVRTCRAPRPVDGFIGLGAAGTGTWTVRELGAARLAP